MYVSCRGDQTSPPSGIQGYVQTVAISSASTCALLESRQVVCWGSLNVSNVTCDALYLYSNTALCLTNKTLTDLVTEATYTTVTSVTTSPRNACFFSHTTPVCLGDPPPVAVGSMYATDDGACIVGAITTCSGSIVFTPRAHTHYTMTTSGNVICNQWDDGWECSRDGEDIPLWPYVTNSYVNPVQVGTVALYASSSELHVCVVDDNEFYCSSYQEHEHDRRYFNANVKNAAVSETHECIVYKVESSFLAWMFVILISVLLLVTVFIGIYQRTHKT